MDQRTLFVGVSPREDGAALAVMSARFTDDNSRAQLLDLRRLSFEALAPSLVADLRDCRTALGSASSVRLIADVGQGVRGQLLISALEELRRQRSPIALHVGAVVITAAGEHIVRPEGAGFSKAPRALAHAALVRIADKRLDIHARGALAIEFLSQLEATRHKRVRDEDEEVDLVDAAAIAAYVLDRAAQPIVRQLERRRFA